MGRPRSCDVERIHPQSWLAGSIVEGEKTQEKRGFHGLAARTAEATGQGGLRAWWWCPWCGVPGIPTAPTPWAGWVPTYTGPAAIHPPARHGKSCRSTPVGPGHAIVPGGLH